MMELYYVLLGVAAVISALSGASQSKQLKSAIQELQATLKDHDSRITALEKR